MQKSPIPPSIGRIVLVRLSSGSRNQPEISPAIVTEVITNDEINVCVFPSGQSPWPVTGVIYSEEALEGQATFHWMDYQRKVAETTDPKTGETKA